MSTYSLEKALEIPNLINEAGNSLIHEATLNNSIKITEFLIDYLESKLTEFFTKHELDEEEADINIKLEIKLWINRPARSSEGFTTLHYASYNGNSKMIKLLIEKGADPYAVNIEGINMLHVAAQGDQAYSLTYFKEAGIDLSETDGENSTPLHWACFSGSDTAIYYLLAWGVNINHQDNLGLTPLHLAVKSLDNFSSLRALKELLIKGANKHIEDGNGFKPI